MSAGVQTAAIIDAATRAGATIIRAHGSTIIVIAEQATDDPDELVPEAEATQIAKCSKRTLNAACRRGELAMFGKQRNRAIRRSDLTAWIESRRVRPVAGADDVDMQRRMARIAKGRAK